MATTAAERMGRVTVEVELANYADVVLAQEHHRTPEQIRRGRISGIVDSGAARLVLPKSIVDQLGFTPDGETNVRYADHRVAKRAIVSNVRLELCGRHGVFSAVVEPKRNDALIGAIVLEDLDLIVDCTNQTVRPRDPNIIISEIE